MTTPAADAAWARLGQMLIRRRVQLSPKYKNRRLFATEHGLDYRLVYEAERARRQNFGEGTVAALEAAYQITPGSIGRALKGEEFEAATPGAPSHDGHDARRPSPPGRAFRLRHVEGIADEAMRALEDQVREEVRACPPGTPPHAIFTSSAEAHLWALSALTEDERTSLIARARAERAARDDGVRRIG